MEHSLRLRFDEIIAELFSSAGYQSTTENMDKLGNMQVDLIVSNKSSKYYIETKYYKSRLVPASAIRISAARLISIITAHSDGEGLLIVNSVVPKKLVEDIFTEFGVRIWDRNTLHIQLSKVSDKLRNDFEQLLLESQQGIDVMDVLSSVDTQSTSDEDYIIPTLESTPLYPTSHKLPNDKCDQLCIELNSISCGRANWSAYERKCIDILKYLFEEDLSLWEEQNSTDDGLSRFDLICRIKSKDDYWKFLIKAFNTRFLLLEFKNYCDPIGQNQIYTTERYLYNKALRSVAIIIAKNGASRKAEIAAKGALKEHGKLILIISDDDLCRMLSLKANGDNPNDYLSDLLDKWLVSLSR